MFRPLLYRSLRSLPGSLGRRYARKHLRWRAREREFPEALRASVGRTCIDLGANVGAYTRRMALVAERVIAFEPDPFAFAVLRARVADLDNVSIENAAAGTSDGAALLYRHPRFDRDPASYSESSSLISGKNNVSEEKAIEVRQVDFIEYLDGLDEDIAILKIDVEGAEVDLLEALLERPDLLERIDHVFVETHESRIPDHEPRVQSLRARVRGMERPRINLYWS